MATAGAFVVTAGAFVVAAEAPAAAAAARTCESFSFTYKGTRWSAKQIRVTRVSCAGARKVIRSYARPRNCMFVSTCHISGLACRTTSTDGGLFTESCRSGKKRLTWNGRYESH